MSVTNDINPESTSSVTVDLSTDVVVLEIWESIEYTGT